MKTKGTNLLLITMSAFWSSSRWDPEGREVSHLVVVIDRFHCNTIAFDRMGNLFAGVLTAMLLAQFFNIPVLAPQELIMHIAS